MSVDWRDRRDRPGEWQGAGQRTPRSGGRTAAQRTRDTDAGRPAAARTGSGRGGARAAATPTARARGAREYPTQGSAALAPVEPVESAWPARPGRSARTGSPASARPAAPGSAAPRLRVAPPLPVAVPRAPFIALILVVVVGGVLGILLVNTKINENSFQLDRLQQRQSSLDIQQQQLEKKIAEAEAPGNLAARARQLGLVESGPPAFIRLPDGRVIGVPQPAGGAPAITSQQGAGG